MTGQNIIDKFHSYISDSLDSDFELQMANDSMHEIEEEVMPEFLKKTDATKSTIVGQTYTTSILLPTDFFVGKSMIYVGTTPYYQIPFEKSIEYRLVNGYYYIDIASGVYRLTGTQGSIEVITFPYSYITTNLTVSTSPVWPAQFHSLIPLKMAETYFAIDQGEKGRAWDDRWSNYYQTRLHRFKDYDSKLKLNSINFSAIDTGDFENRIN